MSNDAKSAFKVYLHNNEYNIRKFMKNHPGGTNLLYRMENKDISQQMEVFKHSNFAYRLLQDYKSKNIISNNSTNDIDEKTKAVVESIELLENIENIVDWSQPMLGQLYKLKSNYKIWTLTPVDRKLRLFSSPILESMTFTPWYVVPIFWLPIIFYLLWCSYSSLVICENLCAEPPISRLTFALNLLCGVGIWTLIEYSLHRWIFHGDPGDSLYLKQIHFLIHGLHHKFIPVYVFIMYPDREYQISICFLVSCTPSWNSPANKHQVPFDELRQVFPPVPAVLLTSLVYMIFDMIFARPIVVLAGGLIGYLLYDMIHFYIHQGSPKDETFLYRMKRYHANHHFINPNQGYGISNKFWDIVFGTKIKMKHLGFGLSWK